MIGSTRRFVACLALLVAVGTGGGCEAPSDLPPPDRLGGLVQHLHVEVPEGFQSHHPALDADRIYVDLAAAKGVVAIDRETGEREWTFHRPVGGPSNLVLHRERLMFAGPAAIALDPVSGAELWRYEPDPAPAESPGFGDSAARDGALYFGGGTEVFAVDAADGTLLWRTDVGPEWEYRAIDRGISVGGDTVYATIERYRSRSGHLSQAYVVALDRVTGEVLWSYIHGDGTTQHLFWGSPTVAGDRLLVADHIENSVIAIDRFTGEAIWSVLFERGYFGGYDAPVVVHDTVLTGSADTNVRALDLATGDVLWSTELAGSVKQVALCGDRILATDGGLWVLDRATGRPLADHYPYGDHGGPVLGWMVTDHSVPEVYLQGSRDLIVYRCPS